ncbi:aldose 1-epimerase [Paracoccus isoporae]|uniref:Aldose 1-epimerase n=1 Tax=Paracoccus isoporae TaxID=591205 RepID=A0A1G7B9I8_9RHOB|nr:aldose epimerase family protein [Paracoccus isoporae]SDE23778.1 aldose 1-epimerase [Paracoccus isoporae]
MTRNGSDGSATGAAAMQTDEAILPDGRPVRGITLEGGGLRARVLTLGAIVQELRLDGIDHPLVLGSPDIAAYLGEMRYVGAIVGRYANRIGQGRFSLGGEDFQTDRNFLDRHTLHGGSDGTDCQIWEVRSHRRDRVTLGLSLPDGHMGFPGHLNLTAQFTLADATLTITLSARSDAATPCSLAHHGYFDLDGGGDIRGHRLSIAAERYLPVDDDLIPTGEIAAVAGTRFDFRQAREIGPGGYDHNFCLSDAPRTLRPVARLTGQGGLAMQVETTACGLQLYDGAHLSGLPGLEGRIYETHAGVALETQFWPDAPNRPDFPDPILRPGDVFSETTRYRFARPGRT